MTERNRHGQLCVMIYLAADKPLPLVPWDEHNANFNTFPAVPRDPLSRLPAALAGAGDFGRRVHDADWSDAGKRTDCV